MLAAFAKGRDGIAGGSGGGGGGERYGFGGGFLPILAAPGMACIVAGNGVGALTKITSLLTSFLTFESSNLLAMSFCMSLNLGLWYSPIGSF